MASFQKGSEGKRSASQFKTLRAELPLTESCSVQPFSGLAAAHPRWEGPSDICSTQVTN